MSESTSLFNYFLLVKEAHGNINVSISIIMIATYSFLEIYSFGTPPLNSDLTGIVGLNTASWCLFVGIMSDTKA